MKIDFQKLGEVLNEVVVDDELFIRVGRYKSEKITGELFIRTNSDNIFRVVSDDSGLVYDFNIIEDDAIVNPIDKDFENTPISYDEVNIHNKSSLRAYFGKSDLGIEMFEYVQSVPPRFRKDALDVFSDKDDLNIWNSRTIDNAWMYFIAEIINEMTDEERTLYHF